MDVRYGDHKDQKVLKTKSTSKIKTTFSSKEYLHLIVQLKQGCRKMKFTPLVALMAVLAGGQAVTAINVWAKFCSNEAHTTDCSINFQVSNPGCFSIDAKSAQWVYFHWNGGFQDVLGTKTYSLIVSPGGGCHCQSDKQVFSPGQITGGKAIRLRDGVAGKPSYRFIEGGGSGNNC